MDKRSASDHKQVKINAKSLWEDDVEVIPVSFGSEADRNELSQITPHSGNLILVDLSNDTNSVAGKIMDKVRKGRTGTSGSLTSWRLPWVSFFQTSFRAGYFGTVFLQKGPTFLLRHENVL